MNISSLQGADRPLPHILCLGLLALFTIGAYSNSFKGPFTFDDLDNIVENHSIRMQKISLAGLKQVAGTHRYLPNLSFALNFAAHRDRVWGYHLVNLIIHVLAAVTLYFLGLITLKIARPDNHLNQEIALAAALLWALHPVQTNAVTYIVQRMTSMAALFFFCSLLFYILGRRQKEAPYKRWLLFGLSLLAGLSALGSKQNSAMLPVMILAYEIFFLRDGDKPKSLRNLAVIAGIVGLSVVLLGLIYTNGNILSLLTSGYEPWDFTLGERLLTEPRVVIMYLTLLVLPLPARLNLDYDFKHSLSLFSPPQTAFAILAIACLAALILFLFRRNRLASFAIFWFLGNLAIESTVLPLDLIFEHRIYLPSAFLFPAVVCLGYDWARERVNLVRAVCLVLAGISLVFTWQRNTVWATDVGLWSDVVKKSPNLARGYVNLGRAIEMEGNHTEAEQILRKAIALDPDTGGPYLILGRVYERQDRFPEAIAALNAAFGKKGGDPAWVHTGLAIIYRRMKNYPAAISEATTALQLAPHKIDALITLGIAFEETGEHERAFDAFEKAKAEGLESVDLYNNWAITCFSLNMTDIAIGHLKRALELDPEHPESHYNLGIAYGSKGLLEEARKEMALAMQLKMKKK